VSSANVGYAFTYQGRLEDESGPVDGVCTIRFSLYDSPTGADQVGNTLQAPGVSLRDGYFSVDLDFGDDAFQGEARYMEIQVDCGDGYATLSPRVTLHPAPYALALPGLWTQQNDTCPNLVGGYPGNSVWAGVEGATIGGGGEEGYANLVTDHYGTIGGGAANQAGDDWAATDDAVVATVGGGWGNAAAADVATVGGGYNNANESESGTIGGGNSNYASGWAATVGGGAGNQAMGEGAVIAGGGGWDEATSTVITNTVKADWGTIGGGRQNTASSDASTVSGGVENLAGGLGSNTVGGGALNKVTDGSAHTISGGALNTISGREANTIAGGIENQVTCEEYGTVGGGYSNTAGGEAATVPGGRGNSAEAFASLAAGQRAHALHRGTFVWADSQGYDFYSNFDNQFTVRSTGGAQFVLEVDVNGLPTWSCGVQHGGTWACASDRNLKENLVAVDGAEVLARLNQVPVYTWNAKNADPAIRHVGPMAQDFYAAFAVGQDDLRIATIDLDGVALAAIQALDQRTQEQAAQLQALQDENEALRQALGAIAERVLAAEQGMQAGAR
jgi:hypothetical protein